MIVVIDDVPVDTDNLIDYHYFNIYFNQDSYYDCEGYY